MTRRWPRKRRRCVAVPRPAPLARHPPRSLARTRAVGRRCGDGGGLEHRAPIRNQEVERRLHVSRARAGARAKRASLESAQRNAGLSQAPTSRLHRRLRILPVHLLPWGIHRWSWDICADTCAICRNSLNEPSIEYQANPSPNNENGLSIAFGCCGRASLRFHRARLLLPSHLCRAARALPRRTQTCSIWTASSAGSRPAPCAHSATKSGSSQRSSGSRDTDRSVEKPPRPRESIGALARARAPLGRVLCSPAVG